ncbi:MAG: transcriptional repressor [Hydrogenibacillus schlegelii]|nr:transcriptional repressor [Hydrogenibacillus schlegelii]
MRPKGMLTRQRKLILDIVRESDDHPSAADVIDRLREKGIVVAYGTVYNSLRYLSEHGYIREIHAGDGVARYDGRMDAHYHIRCRICNRLEEVHAPAPPEWLRRVAQETGFDIGEGGILLEGICADCRKKEASAVVARADEDDA